MRKALLACGVSLIAWALLVAITGGLNLRPYGIPFQSTDADRAAIAALLLMTVYAMAFRAHARAHVRWVDARARPLVGFLERRGTYIAAALAVIIFALGMAYGIHVAGGSDSYGYIS